MVVPVQRRLDDASGRLRRLWVLTPPIRVPRPESSTPEDLMRWLDNILPAERNLYIGVAAVLLFLVASFVIPRFL